MKLLQRPSLYLASVPVLLSGLAFFLHEAMDCGLQCTGTISGPLDFIARVIMFYGGLHLPWFWAAALISLIGEILYSRWPIRRE